MTPAIVEVKEIERCYYDSELVEMLGMRKCNLTKSPCCRRDTQRVQRTSRILYAMRAMKRHISKLATKNIQLD